MYVYLLQAAKFGISRADQDAFAARSHQLAAKAHKDGIYKDELIAVDGSLEENGIRVSDMGKKKRRKKTTRLSCDVLSCCFQGDSTAEKLGKLPPAFIKPHGTHTAANSSFLSDGASASLIMEEEKALKLGLKPKAYIRAWEYVAVDPFEELLLGEWVDHVPSHYIW